MNNNGRHWITGVSLTFAVACVFYAGILWNKVESNSINIERAVKVVEILTGVVFDIKSKQDQRTFRFEDIDRRLDELDKRLDMLEGNRSAR